MKNSNRLPSLFLFFFIAFLFLPLATRVYSQDTTARLIDQNKIKKMIDVKKLSQGVPSIGVWGSIHYYGFKDFDKSFEPNESFRIKLGYAYLQRFEKLLITDQFSGIDFEITSILINNSLKKDLILDFINFGLSLDRGYGYNFDDLFISYNKRSSLFWSEVSYDKKQNIIPFDSVKRFSKTISKLTDGTRFGKSTSDGIKITAFKRLNFYFEYEQSNIYPRYLFWKQSGSIFLEYASWALVEGFVLEIENNSAALAPIMSMALNFGLNKAFFELRKKRMAWPFASSEPLSIRKLSFGVSYAF